MVSGRYQRKPPLPFVPAAEVAGIVTDVADGCESIKVGDRVCAVLDWGGLGEVAVANEVNTFKIPDGLEFNQAISFTNSYATSAAALTWPHLLRLAASETLLVHGAAGGVGLAAIEIGKILGATVIATAGSAAKLDAAKEHGADHVINYREEDFRAAVNDLTNGIGANAIYDPVGGEVFAQSLRCVAPEGRIMPVGFASGTIPQIPANILLVKNITVTGLNMGYYIGWSPDDVRYEKASIIHPLMQQMFDWFEAGNSTLVFGKRTSLRISRRHGGCLGARCDRSCCCCDGRRSEASGALIDSAAPIRNNHVERNPALLARFYPQRHASEPHRALAALYVFCEFRHGVELAFCAFEHLRTGRCRFGIR